MKARLDSWGRRLSERVPHEKRPEHYGMSHVIYRLKRGLPKLRKPAVLRVLEPAFRAAKERRGFKIVAYSLQKTHIHLIVEGRCATELSRGMQGLGVSITRRLNRLWGRRGEGTVFRQRFQQVTLHGRRQIATAVNYVLNNALKHGDKRADGTPDRYSSAPWWPNAVERCRRPLREAPVARSSLMEAMCGGMPPRVSWRDVPGPKRYPADTGCEAAIREELGRTA